MQSNYKWMIRSAALVIVFCLPVFAMAQFPNCPDPTVDCPIDGGLSLLLAAGVGYGVKKVRDSRKKKQAEENI